MAEEKLQLPEGVADHGALQRRIWAVQRAAWVVFALILVGCLLGAFGRDGYFARSTSSSQAGVVDFPLLTRWNVPDNLMVTFAPSADDRIFYVDSRFFDTFSVEGLDPPQKATLIKNGLTGYVFSGDPVKPTRVTFRLQTQTPGLQTQTFGIDGQIADRSIFVFP